MKSASLPKEWKSKCHTSTEEKCHTKKEDMSDTDGAPPAARIDSLECVETFVLLVVSPCVVGGRSPLERPFRVRRIAVCLMISMSSPILLSDTA